MATHEEKKFLQWFDSLPAHLQEDETMKFVQWTLMQPDVEYLGFYSAASLHSYKSMVKSRKGSNCDA